MNDAHSRAGLILTGGGARAAYQVGVLRAVADVWGDRRANPFPILCGTSAGAINVAALACNAGHFRKGVGELLRVWRRFDVSKVYRSDAWGVGRTGARWLGAMVLGGLGRSNPAFLFDNAPLRALIESRFAFDRIAENIGTGDLYALAVNATGYSSAQSVTFFEAATSAQPWMRARRAGVPATIGVDHLMASSAIPFVFPAVRIHREFFGDGSMRQVAPVSAALHLGADRVLVVAVGRLAKSSPPRYTTPDYPSMAQIAGHVLSSIFLDSLEVDLARLQRINRTIGVMPPELRARHGVALKHIETFVIAPSEDIEPIAARYAHRLPRTVRFFLRGIGATRATGSNLLSYLLFDREYCRALIRLGYRDAMARRDELAAFLAGATSDARARAEAAVTLHANERAIA
jgi:NTE family protein